MNSEWIEMLRQQFLNVNLLDAAVLVLGVTEVLLARANNVLLYPAGIAATTLAIYSLIIAGLYAESALHGYYLLMSIYGWWYWMSKPEAKPVEVTFATRAEWRITLGIIGGGWLIFFGALKFGTPSTVPAWDAWVSATGWAGMWLLARRKVENWIVLNVSNLFAVPLLFYKQLPLFAVLTIFLFVVACFGYVDWLKIIRRRQNFMAVQ